MSDQEPIILDFDSLKNILKVTIVWLLVIVGLAIIVLSAYFSYSISDSTVYLIIGNRLSQWRIAFRICMFLSGLATGIAHISVAWLLNEKLG